jgi:hypothetical protein
VISRPPACLNALLMTAATAAAAHSAAGITTAVAAHAFHSIMLFRIGAMTFRISMPGVGHDGVAHVMHFLRAVSLLQCLAYRIAHEF